MPRHHQLGLAIAEDGVHDGQVGHPGGGGHQGALGALVQGPLELEVELEPPAQRQRRSPDSDYCALSAAGFNRKL